MDHQPTFKLTILTARETLFTGEVLALTSVNSQGKFDILAQHANFVTLIENKPIEVILPDKRKIQYQFNRAIISNFNNYTSVFAEPAI